MAFGHVVIIVLLAFSILAVRTVLCVPQCEQCGRLLNRDGFVSRYWHCFMCNVYYEEVQND